MPPRLPTTLLLLPLLHPAAPRLVVDTWDSLRLPGGDWDHARVVEEADLVNITERPSEACPGTTEELMLFEVFTKEEGSSEISHLLEVVKLIDITTDTMQVRNALEPWWVGSVMIR